jgi:tetratricopeptide (TPR) repeat protein
MIAILLTALSPLLAPQERISVEISRENGDVYCDVRADDAPLRQIMQSLCSALDLELGGFESVDLDDAEGSPAVSVYLRHRPLNVVVDYILGAAGLAGSLGAGRIDVANASPPFPSRDELLQVAEIAFLEALQQFPDGARTDETRAALADVAIQRGEPAKAARHYELLIATGPDRPEHLETRMKAGRLFVELQEWGRAMPLFRFVAESQAQIELVVEARRELARCILMRGESAQALHMLRALEHLLPPVDDRDAAQRLILMARAEVRLERPVDALQSLERARRLGPQYVDELEVMDLRARALELKDRPVEAALAWLHFSRGRSDKEKREALVRAAQIALSTEGEELFVIFLHKHAENEGLGAALVPYVNEARARLGLGTETYTGASLTIRLLGGVQYVDAGLEDEAARAFESIAPQFNKLSVSERVTFALTYAPLLEHQQGVSYAIDLLRNVVRTLESVDDRSRLYVLAGEIYERNERFDDAAAAYGGRL